MSGALLPSLVKRLLPRWRRGEWWHQQAVESIERGWWRAIAGRGHDQLYLLRLWMVQPIVESQGRARPDEPESGNAVLVHWIVRADDDAALHDHPWAFATTILQGGYYELLPARTWIEGAVGPGLDRTVQRNPGQTVRHACTDLHAVGGLIEPAHGKGLGGGCWTMVRTGMRVREWGFHPPGGAWTPWQTYLAQRAAGQS